MSHEGRWGSPRPAPADLEIALLLPVLSQFPLQRVPSRSRAVGKGTLQPGGGTAPGTVPGAAQSRQPAGTARGAAGLAPLEPEGRSAEHKGSPILAALPWNAAWEPLPSESVPHYPPRLIPAPSPLAAQPRSRPISRANSAHLGQTRVRAGIPLRR